MVDGGIVRVRDLAEEVGRMWWNVVFRQLCVVHDSILFLFFFFDVLLWFRLDVFLLLAMCRHTLEGGGCSEENLML